MLSITQVFRALSTVWCVVALSENPHSSFNEAQPSSVSTCFQAKSLHTFTVHIQDFSISHGRQVNKAKSAVSTCCIGTTSPAMPLAKGCFSDAHPGEKQKLLGCADPTCQGCVVPLCQTCVHFNWHSKTNLAQAHPPAKAKSILEAPRKDQAD